MEEQFLSGSVPIAVVSRIFGKDASWVRAGIIAGWLPIGNATRNGQIISRLEDIDSKQGRINFYVSPKKLFDETGFNWKGEKR
jgi:hypothetical protein